MEDCLRRSFAPALLLVQFCVQFVVGCGSNSDTVTTEHNAVSLVTLPGEDNTRREDQFVLTPQHIDLGDIAVQTEPFRVTFEIKNGTGKTLYLDKIESTCGCTVAVPDRKELAPNEVTTINASVKVRELGTRSSRLRVQTKGSEFSATGEIRWQAGSTVVVSPGSLSFGNVACGRTKTEAIKITTPDGSDIQSWLLHAVVLQSQDITLVRDDKGDTSTLSVTLSATNPTPGSRTSLQLSLKPPIGTISVPVDWRSSENILIEPKGVFRGSVKPGVRWKQTFLLRSEDIEIEAVSCTGDSLLSSERLRAGLLSCEIGGEFPCEPGPFNLEIPIEAVLREGQKKQLVFCVSGIVDEAKDVSN